MATESPKSSRSTPASSPLSGGEAPQDEDSVLRERIARQKDSPAAGSHSPKAPPRMNMRISYAEKNEEGKTACSLYLTIPNHIPNHIYYTKLCLTISNFT